MKNGVFEYEGTKYWYVDDKLHRLDGPAAECNDGRKEWYVGGKRHRLDGPAVEGSDGSKVWYVDDKRHRTDGPAMEYSSGRKEWYVDGKRLGKADFSLALVEQLNAWGLFTAPEIAKLGENL